MPPQGSPRDRLRTHDLQLEQLQERTSRAPTKQAQGGTPRFNRLAWTAALDGFTYPTSGAILPIRFVTSGGSHTSFLPRSTDGSTTVFMLSEEWLPEGTLIGVFEVDAQWWSDSPVHLADEIEGFLTADLEVTDGSGSGDMDVFSGGVDPGVSHTITNPPSGVRSGEYVFAGPSGARFRARRFGTTYRFTWVECTTEEEE